MDSPTDKFVIGEMLTPSEVRTAFTRITGRPVPTEMSLKQVAGLLTRHFPARFEHEVNRVRGYAFDLQKDGTCV